MLHDVIMPALGMAQETGIIVNWLKQPGDSVDPDDILMEIETDKAVMEVAAGYQGVIAELRADVEVAVRVGSVVAVIDSDGDGAYSADTSSKSVVEKITEPELVDADAQHTPPTRLSNITTHDAVENLSIVKSERIFASPKARYQAHVRGISLHSLLQQGATQPIHVADLPLFREESETHQIGARAVLRGKINRAVTDEFMSWVRQATEGTLTSAGIWAVFCAAAFRQQISLQNELGINVKVSAYAANFPPEIYQNPDLNGLGQVHLTRTDNTPQIDVHDLTDTAISEYVPASLDSLLCITLTRDGRSNYVLSLYFNDGTVAMPTAVAFLENLISIGNEPRRLLC